MGRLSIKEIVKQTKASGIKISLALKFKVRPNIYIDIIIDDDNLTVTQMYEVAKIIGKQLEDKYIDKNKPKNCILNKLNNHLKIKIKWIIEKIMEVREKVQADPVK